MRSASCSLFILAANIALITLDSSIGIGATTRGSSSSVVAARFTTERHWTPSLSSRASGSPNRKCMKRSASRQSTVRGTSIDHTTSCRTPMHGFRIPTPSFSKHFCTGIASNTHPPDPPSSVTCNAARSSSLAPAWQTSSSLTPCSSFATGSTTNAPHTNRLLVAAHRVNTSISPRTLSFCQAVELRKVAGQIRTNHIDSTLERHMMCLLKACSASFRVYLLKEADKASPARSFGILES